MKTTIKMALAAVALSFATFSQAEVASSSEHGFQIQLEQSFEGSAQQGYRHFINNVSEWWLDAHTWFGYAANLSIDATAGGCFCEINGDLQAMHMQVAYVDPRKTLRLVGGLGPLQSLGMNGTMTISFSDNKVSLNYIVGGYPTTDFTKLAPIVDGVLAQQLASFSQTL